MWSRRLEKLGKTADLVVIDCLTLWISNLMLRNSMDDGAVLGEADKARGGADRGTVREYRRDRRSWIGNRADRFTRSRAGSAICWDGPIRKSRRSGTRC